MTLNDARKTIRTAGTISRSCLAQREIAATVARMQIEREEEREREADHAMLDAALEAVPPSEYERDLDYGFGGDK